MAYRGLHPAVVAVLWWWVAAVDTGKVQVKESQKNGIIFQFLKVEGTQSTLRPAVQGSLTDSGFGEAS